MKVKHHNRRSARRPGLSLGEVLVAMFVMSLGMISLLTLFPLGAMQVAQGLKDSRCAETAAQADGLMRTYWRHTVLETGSDTTLGTAMMTPGSGATTALGGPFATPNSGEPSYPLFVDPIGHHTRNSIPMQNEQSWVARLAPGSPSVLIPRRPLMATPNINDSLRLCSMLDDLGFEIDGTASVPITRGGRYSWSAIIQRPDAGVSGTVSLKILVFDGRNSFLAAREEEFITTAAVDANTNTRTVTITLPERGPEQAPLVRRGGWIMDGTVFATAWVSGTTYSTGEAVTDATTGRSYVFIAPTGVSTTAPDVTPTQWKPCTFRLANFYRIVGVTEASAGTNITYTLDLDRDFKHPTVSKYTAQLYLFAGLSEVFDRPMLQPDP